MRSPSLPISVAIPTYRREKVLLDTLDYLLALDAGPTEIIVVDQTLGHETATTEKLTSLNNEGHIHWIKLETPSITHAMNCALLAAKEDIVLFLDDDIRPEPELISNHYVAHQKHADVLVAGRVIQPWEEGFDFSGDSHFHFAAMKHAWITEFMGGNFSLRKNVALSLGGFDENFVRVAYRFEAEFAHRFTSSGKRIYFEANACLHHLKESAGGTRAFSEHLTTWRPDHAVGAYYFALRTKTGGRWLKDFISRPISALMTRHHLRHPWWIPLTLIAELRGMFWALGLTIHGPRFVQQDK